ncbi:MAG: adenosylmethionine--8-amino-7-oxononanoate transaminase [Thermoleophilaceae bacterium]
MTVGLAPSIVAEDHACLWHPFTQQQGWEEEEPLVIERAEGRHLFDDRGRAYLDGVSSLWCNVHGHRHPTIDRAVREQLDRVAHSTMLGLTHEPGVRLARRLVELAPPGLSRVFYSDSGSTATEIAIKMAFQHFQQRGGPDARRTRFVTLRDAYHGDTIGSVSVGGIDLFHSMYRPLLFDALVAEPGDAADLDRVLAAHPGEVAAVIVEPLVQGAAGIRLHPDGYLREVRELCDRHGALLICDEVATGFGRTGRMFACEHEDVAPDLMCLAKGISGGYLPLAATLATEHVYESFLGRFEDFRTFFHGHTYTGNPAGLRGGAGLARRVRGGAHPRTPRAEDRAARGAARAGGRHAGRGRGAPARGHVRHRARRLHPGRAHGPPGDARGAAPRRDRAAARRRGHPHAAAGDHRGGAAGAGRDRGSVDRGGGRRSDGGRAQRSMRARRPNLPPWTAVPRSPTSCSPRRRRSSPPRRPSSAPSGGSSPTSTATSSKD